MAPAHCAGAFLFLFLKCSVYRGEDSCSITLHIERIFAVRKVAAEFLVAHFNPKAELRIPARVPIRTSQFSVELHSALPHIFERFASLASVIAFGLTRVPVDYIRFIGVLRAIANMVESAKRDAVFRGIHVPAAALIVSIVISARRDVMHLKMRFVAAPLPLLCSRVVCHKTALMSVAFKYPEAL